MKTTPKLIACSLIALTATLAIRAAASEPSFSQGPERVIRATMDLTDGSRLIGIPLQSTLPLALSYMEPMVPCELIRTCEFSHNPDRITLHLHNGDRMSGSPRITHFPITTILGNLSPQLSQIDRIEFSATPTGLLPAGCGDISFANFKWTAWRTKFEVRGDKLVSLPVVRDGFNYGHGGHGRGAQITTGIGDPAWTDFRIETDLCLSGVNPAFNPYSLPANYRSASILFRIAAAAESWNQPPGTTAYSLNFGEDGSWSITAGYDSYCKTDCGYGNPYQFATHTLAEGKGLQLDPSTGNRIRLEVRGNHIAAWLDEHPIADVRDEKMSVKFAGKSLAAGGIGFLWGFESMGWIRNFSATRL